MAATRNLLPGSRKPVPYVLETCMLPSTQVYPPLTDGITSLVLFAWKMIDLNKVGDVATGPAVLAHAFPKEIPVPLDGVQQTGGLPGVSTLVLPGT